MWIFLPLQLALTLLVLCLCLPLIGLSQETRHYRFNQVGYWPSETKSMLLLSDEPLQESITGVAA